MNIRKTLVFVLILAVASLGLTGCKQKSDQPPAETAPAAEHPSQEVVEKAAEAVDESAEAVQKAAEAVEEAAEHPAGEHPTGEHPQ